MTGEAIIRGEPDEAVLWITLSTLASAPGAALADVARRSAAQSGTRVGSSGRGRAGARGWLCGGGEHVAGDFP